MIEKFKEDRQYLTDVISGQNRRAKVDIESVQYKCLMMQRDV